MWVAHRLNILRNLSSLYHICAHKSLSFPGNTSSHSHDPNGIPNSFEACQIFQLDMVNFSY